MPSSHDTALAFGLVLGAGASTAIGAAAVWLVKPGIDMRIPLACSLGLSAGVMIYISFVEIFAIKSIEGFKNAGYDNAEASRFATLCFFGGMAVLWVLDKMVHALLHIAEHYKTHWCHGLTKQASSQVQLLPSTSNTMPSLPQLTDVEQATPSTNTEQTQQPVAFIGHDSNDLQAQSQAQHPSTTNPQHHQQPNAHNSTSPREVSPAASVIGNDQAMAEVEQFNRVHDTHEAVAMILRTDGKNVGLSRTGLLAAMAIGIHNLPEGLATYVATLGDPTAGVVIALAIALHNIPEGIVVAMPIYIASGSRWKGFFWGCLSGVTEPLGALLGFAVLRGGDMPPIAHGVMLGLVAGMMVWISLTELLPTAFKYDPKHTVTIAALVTGMVIMALSLILFEV